MIPRRKSVSQTIFSGISSVLLVGLFIMVFLQTALSIRYFAAERKTALSGTLDVACAVAETMNPYAMAARVQRNREDDAMSQKLELINQTTEAMLVFVDDSGNPLQMVGNDSLLAGERIPKALLEKMDTGRDVYVQGNLGGAFTEKCYVMGRAVDSGGERYYVLACSLSSGMNDYVSDMFSTFILSAGLMLLVCSLLTIMLTGRITRPLHDIGEAAKRFGGGDFSVRAPVRGDDEVAALAQTFNAMAVNLESIDKSRSQFMGNIAHELRTPMTTIKGFVDGMMDGTIPPELQQHYLGIVSQETGRLARLVQNMLDITKLEAGEYKVNARCYDVWDTITGVVLSDEQRITDGKVEIEGLSPVRTTVYADPDLVHQVVYNLVDNALKFTPQGGSISFNVSRIAGGMVEVSITNTGVGISREALPFVFERFYKEDKSRGLNKKGSGLGLHICKVLITLSGGTIRVESEQGAWCRFVFTLPEQPPKPEKKAES